MIVVQSRNVYPQLLFARLFFSLGASACSTMVSAILPALHSPFMSKRNRHSENARDYTTNTSPIRVTTASLERPPLAPVSEESVRLSASSTPKDNSHSKPHSRRNVLTSLRSRIGSSSPNRMAGFVGLLTGCGALLALGAFLPLPARLQRSGLDPAKSITVTYYIVGTVSLLVSIMCFFGLQGLRSEGEKSLKPVLSEDDSRKIAFRSRIIGPFSLGFTHPSIGLAYLGGFVAR